MSRCVKTLTRHRWGKWSRDEVEHDSPLLLALTNGRQGGTTTSPIQARECEKCGRLQVNYIRAGAR